MHEHQHPANMPNRCWWIVLWWTVVAACGSQSPGVSTGTSSVGPNGTNTLPSTGQPVDAGASDAWSSLDDGGIETPVIYALSECPRRALDAALPIDAPLPAPQGCKHSSDCTQQPYGVCSGRAYPDRIVSPRCLYDECATDAECPADTHCRCSYSGLRRCIRVDCEEDADCGDASRCERTTIGCLDEQLGDYVCTTPDDECVTHDDCPNAGWCFLDGPRRICIWHTCE